ncbi:hypothetical protein K493DRAFT_337205 [Basidiobolus meristosporus CBS 931.73]|uniref:Arrestin C-terminal-like domain-containing protein n=1 Tax=Basidiobolus meristosporus CBS 931.73 TaxID=1314790 RepID=A0A1Y1YCP5_9FUNG|nr:hypothetical protein K493DRAFT_337205 [Basidiobolus meristosporus CBS 931.73]|eukprot:ORX95757.1 hypothetical protein K493DRAFT_337205 [Basidiobolus meristosporus CBS 931.73]
MHTNNLLDIQLETDTLIFNGSPSDSAGALLKGKVILRLKEATKLRSLTLNLKGRAKTTWTESYGTKAFANYAKRKLVDHSWILLEPKKEGYQFMAGEYTYMFEYVFSGSLPETIHIDSGKVEYKLQASAERSFLQRNLSTEKEIIIKRYTNCQSNESTDLVGIWEGKVRYEVHVPVKCFGLGESVPISINVASLVEQAHIKRVVCFLKESITNRIPEINKFNVDHNWLRLCSEKLTPTSHLETTLQLQIPNNSKSVHIDYRSELIRIRHILQVKIEVEKANLVDYVILDLPIYILPAAHDDFFQDLPSYSPQYLEHFALDEYENSPPPYPAQDTFTNSVRYNVQCSR